MKLQITHKNIFQFMLFIIIGTICSILIGYSYFGLKVFNPKISSFQFFITGLIGAIFYATLKVYKLRNALFILLFLFIFHEIIIKTSTLSYFIRDLLFIGGISLSIIIFINFFHEKLKEIKFGKFLTFASLFTITYIIITVILGLFLSPVEIKNVLLTNVFIGSLLGIGLGIGLELSEILFPIILSNIEKD